MEKKLLSPWAEVKTQVSNNNVEIKVWGRSYKFFNSAFPTSIVSADEELLSSPVRLIGMVNGKPLVWENQNVFSLQSNNLESVVSGCQSNNDLIVNVTFTVEFDGMMRMDIVLFPHPQNTSDKKTPTIDNLWLEIPFNHKTTLFHYWPGCWGNANNSGMIPDAGLSLPFKPAFWLGWEEAGLSWFAESDKGWRPAKDNQCIEVVKKDKEIVLRFRLLDTPPEKLPLTFTMGLQATPVKPIPRDFHQWRVYHYGTEKRLPDKEAIDILINQIAELGVTTFILHEGWTPIQSYWKTSDGAKLKYLISEAHKIGIKVLLYFGYHLSTLAPEWTKMADDVLIKDVNGGLIGEFYYLPKKIIFYRLPDQTNYTVCHNSKWQDSFVNGITQALEDYNFDGLYLDGTIEPWPCANQNHGCGYKTTDGHLKVSYPIFAVRKLMKHLYSIIQAKGGIIEAHQSTCCITPILSFCHCYRDGEHLMDGRLDTETLKKLPLATFRAEFMGKNFGVPCRFIVYERPPLWTYEHALSITLLHDVLIRSVDKEGNEDFKVAKHLSKICNIMSNFGVSVAKWYPYWKNEKFLKVEPEDIKVSFYKNGNRLLLVVSNLSGERNILGNIILNPDALELTTDFKLCYDTITGQHISLKDYCIQIPLAPLRARLIQIE